MSDKNKKLQPDQTEDPEEVFEMIEVIGEGAFGLICTCENKQTNEVVAIKFLDVEEGEEESLTRELDLLKKASHSPYTVQYNGCYLKESTLMIVMEFCEGGSCLDLMKLAGHSYSEREIQALCLHALKGLEMLHNINIIHRDIKAGNILLHRSGYAKLADFGVSKQIGAERGPATSCIGSPYWMAPEVITTTQSNQSGDSDQLKSYGALVDIWSMGITLIELAEKQPPLFNVASMRVIFKIPIEPPPQLQRPSPWTEAFHTFLARCLKKEASQRPSAVELQKDPWMKEVAGSDVDILKNLFNQVFDPLEKARKERREKQSANNTGTGTITVNKRTGTFSTRGTMKIMDELTTKFNTVKFSEEEEEEDDKYGTTNFK